MRIIKNISLFLIIGFVISLLCKYLHSTFFLKYLNDNIIGLLLTLLAINTATLGLIASKIQDTIEKYKKLNFTNTIREMKFSLFEQVVLIILSIIVLILSNSSIIEFPHKELFFNSILVSILIYSIIILYDTGKAVFVIIELIQKIKDNENNV